MIKFQAVCHRGKKKKNRSEQRAISDPGKYQQALARTNVLSEPRCEALSEVNTHPDVHITTMSFEGTVKHGKVLRSKYLSEE